MAARHKPYEQFGPFVLFKKLESDSLGDLWRAARIEGQQIGSTVALRRLGGGRREALVENAHAVAQILPHLIGTSFVRGQQVLIVDGVPCLSWEYGGGRSLRHIIDQSRGNKERPASPLPLDQALVIAEKVSLSLATMADLRDSHGTRLFHGALLPQFVWIGDDGEIRVAGQRMGPGIIASLSDAGVNGEVGRYFAPEYREGSRSHNISDVYSMGALLFLLVTGQEPPDAATASAFIASVRGARTTAGNAIPEEIRIILDKSLNIDPSMRYGSMNEMKQAVSALAQGGKYSGSTFNLAFYLSTLLKKELEIEATERATEANVSAAAYLQPSPRGTASVPQPAPMFAAALAEPQARSRLPLILGAAALVVAAGAGGFMMMRQPTAQPAVAQTTAAQLVTPAVVTPPAATEPAPPLIENASEAPGSTDLDPEAQKRAFEDAVRQKLQAEMMKLQNDFMAELRGRQAASPPATATAASQSAAEPRALLPEERATLAAAEIDQQRRETRQSETQAETQSVPPAASQQVAAVTPTQQSAITPQATTPVTGIREGDLIDAAILDSVPRPMRPIRPIYPPVAARQKISATIILTALISKDGEVLDVRVLKGDARFGLNDAAVRAIRATRFSSPVKEGKRVSTWLPQKVEFNPN